MKISKYSFLSLSYFLFSSVLIAQTSDTTLARQYLDKAQLLFDSADYNAALLLQKKALALYEKVQGKEDTLTANAHFYIGRTLTETGKYQEALDQHQKAFEIRQLKLGKEHPDLASSFHYIGAVQVFIARYNAAMANFHKAQKIRLKLYGENHPDVARGYHNIGVAKYYISELDSSLLYSEKALKVRLKLFGQDNNEVAETYNSLAGLYREDDQFDKAIHYFSTALEIRRRLIGESHPSLARLYGNLGLSYSDKSDYDKALELYNKALEINDLSNGGNPSSSAYYYYLIGEIYLAKTAFDKALKAFHLSEEIYNKIPGEKNTNIAYAYFGLGSAYTYLAKYDESLNYFQKALDIFEMIYPKGHPEISSTYQNIGLIYSDKRRSEKALFFLFKAVESKKAKYGEWHTEVALAYASIANCYQGIGDYNKALRFYQRALYIQLKVLDEKHASLAITYNNIGIAYLEINDYEKTLYYLDKALSIHLDIFGEKHGAVADAYTIIGKVHFKKNDLDSAQFYHQKSLEIKQLVYGREHPKTAGALHNLARVYERKKKYDEAIEMFKEAVQIEAKVHGTKHLNVAMYNYNIGICHLYKGEAEAADLYFHKSLDIYRELLEEGHPKMARPYFQIGYLCKKNKQYDLASTYYDSSLICLRNIRKVFDSPLSKESHLSKHHEIYEKMIRSSLESNFQAQKDSLKPFSIAEQAKSAMLLDALNASNAKHFSGIPDSLIQKEEDFQQEIVFYDKIRQQLMEKDTMGIDTAILAVENKLSGYKQQLENLIGQLEHDFPAYYQAKYDFSTVDVTFVQNNLLDQNQSLVEYYVGDSSIYIFIILTDNFHILEIKKDFPLEKWVQDMRCGILAVDDTSSCGQINNSNLQAQYASSAYFLYQKIFSPIDSILPDSADIIIIPDGVLGYLPFDVLLVAPPEKGLLVNQYHYLLRDHTISYAYSATLLKEMKYTRHRREPSKNLLAFAPSFDGNTVLLASRLIDLSKRSNRLDSLLYNIPEVEAIGQIIASDIVIGNAATKTAFTQQAGGYRILHLSTHGKANDQVGDYSYLAFHQLEDNTENGLLYNRELYNLELNADLVVLSACETGIGELKRGEGIISLARGFSYAGAKSIVTSLWSVNDKSTQVLMELFYKNLKKGMAKDKALRQAKLDYLKDSPNLGHEPFFWAAFIPIGDMSPIELSGSVNFVWWLIGGVFFLGIAILLYSIFKKVRKENNSPPL